MSGLDTFDRMMDLAEGVVDGLTKPVEARPAKNVRPKKGTELVADVSIVEAIDGETGAVIFIVRQGSDRAECSSSGFADRIAKLLREDNR